MTKQSAGLLVFRHSNSGIEVLLVHPGGPFWAKKDDGAWTIPKGLLGEDEDTLVAARREFQEETGLPITEPLIELGEVRNPSGKHIHAWAFEGNFNPKAIRSNTFSMEWPPKSGITKEFPEIDKAEYFSVEDAKIKIHAPQVVFLERLCEKLGITIKPEPQKFLFDL